LSHQHGPTVQPRAGTLLRLRGDGAPWVRHGVGLNPLAAGRFEDVMPLPEMLVPTGRCRLACPECPCIEKGRLSAAAGLPRHKNTGPVENPPKDQVRKGRPPGALSTLIARVPGRRLDAMTAPTREQPADRSSAAACPHCGPLLMRKHLARRHAPLSVAFPPSRRRLRRRVRFDGAGVVQATRAESGARPPSCAKEAIGCTRAGGADERHRRIDRRYVR